MSSWMTSLVVWGVSIYVVVRISEWWSDRHR